MRAQLLDDFHKDDKLRVRTMPSSRYGYAVLFHLTRALEAKRAHLERRLEQVMAAAPAEAVAGLPYHLVLRFGPGASGYGPMVAGLKVEGSQRQRAAAYSS